MASVVDVAVDVVNVFVEDMADGGKVMKEEVVVVGRCTEGVENIVKGVTTGLDTVAKASFCATDVGGTIEGMEDAGFAVGRAKEDMVSAREILVVDTKVEPAD